MLRSAGRAACSVSNSALPRRSDRTYSRQARDSGGVAARFPPARFAGRPGIARWLPRSGRVAPVRRPDWSVSPRDGFSDHARLILPDGARKVPGLMQLQSPFENTRRGCCLSPQRDGQQHGTQRMRQAHESPDHRILSPRKDVQLVNRRNSGRYRCVNGPLTLRFRTFPR